MDGRKDSFLACWLTADEKVLIFVMLCPLLSYSFNKVTTVDGNTNLFITRREW